MRPGTLSNIFRGLFMLALLVMVVLGVMSLLNQPPTPEEAITRTIEAGVSARSTEIAIMTGTPNPAQMQATVNAIVDATLAAPAGSTTPASPADQAGPAVGGVLGWLWGMVTWLWNLFSFGGVWMQVCCCIALPGIVLIAMLRDGTLGK